MLDEEEDGEGAEGEDPCREVAAPSGQEDVNVMIVSVP